MIYSNYNNFKYLGVNSNYTMIRIYRDEKIYTKSNKSIIMRGRI